MKRILTCLVLTVTLCLLLFGAVIPASAAMERIPNDNYQKPNKTIRQFTEGRTPQMDGIVTEEEWGEKLFTINKKLIEDGEGHIWFNSDLFDEDFPAPNIDGNFYMGWDKDHIYIAMVMKDSFYFHKPGYIRKDNYFKIQISDRPGGTRYEMDFVYSTQFNLPIGFQWDPLPESILRNPDAVSEPDRVFYTALTGNKLIYEVRLHRSFFGREKEWTAGDVIPFAFGVQLNNPNHNEEEFSCEWGGGVFGENSEKDINAAARITLEELTVFPQVGHVRGKPTVGIEDARLVLQHLTGKTVLTPVQLDMADVNSKDGVTVADARMILQKLVGKISEFPRK